MFLINAVSREVGPSLCGIEIAQGWRKHLLFLRKL
jgi:hypothetical protein